MISMGLNSGENRVVVDYSKDWRFICSRRGTDPFCKGKLIVCLTFNFPY